MAKIEETRGKLVHLDNEKAYDRIDREWLIQSLQAFGFSEKYTRLIKPIYMNNQASLILSNHLTTPFPVNQGIRQGDPLSPLLYNIAIEPLLIKLKSVISGIKIPNIPSIVTTAFADDITVAVADQRDADTLFEVIDRFHRASNSKINRQKSEAVPLSQHTRLHLQLPCRYIQEEGSFTLLGIPFNTKSIFPRESYFEELRAKLQKTVESWKTRSLSLIGKVHLVNSRLLSKLWYISQLIPPPSKFLKCVNNIIKSFIWGGKRPQISMEILQQPG
ncbi:uncharacterized protein VTP21DRAFT_8987 [Calcarisporiella thermophila]|uniref:uncharacterized protein n=1 Tax=Calcarisporiella thermophila TaxID=911321 RepID=UPI0037420F87